MKLVAYLGFESKLSVAGGRRSKLSVSISTTEISAI